MGPHTPLSSLLNHPPARRLSRLQILFAILVSYSQRLATIKTAKQFWAKSSEIAVKIFRAKTYRERRKVNSEQCEHKGNTGTTTRAESGARQKYPSE